MVTIAHNLTLVFFSYHNNLFDLTTAHVLLDFNSAQRKEFWSVRRLVCYNNTPDSLCTDLKFALRKGRWVLNNVIQPETTSIRVTWPSSNGHHYI